MNSGLKYLFQNAINCRSNNRELSGGLPHSEIRGSKPILGSSRLIAEYHVLHRLLLPRHSPNALLALDLIQKKTGFRPSRRGAGSTHTILLKQSILSRFCRCRSAETWLVYLTWTTLLLFSAHSLRSLRRPVLTRTNRSKLIVSLFTMSNALVEPTTVRLDD
jgi:hypothetical protein